MTPLARKRSMAAKGAADAGSGQMPSRAPSVTTQRAISSFSMVMATPLLRRRTSTACTVPWLAPIDVAMEAALRGRSGGIGSPLAIAAVIEPETSAATRRGMRSIQPRACNSPKPFHMPNSASP